MKKVMAATALLTIVGIMQPTFIQKVDAVFGAGKSVVTDERVLASTAFVALVLKNQGRQCPFSDGAQNPAASVVSGLTAWRAFHSENKYVKYGSVVPAAAAVYFALKK